MFKKGIGHTIAMQRKGAKSKAKEIAASLLRSGMPSQEVARHTGLKLADLINIIDSDKESMH